MKNVVKRAAFWAALSVGLSVTLSACFPVIMGGMVAGAMSASDRRTSGAQIEDQGIEIKGANRLSDAFGERAHVNITSYNRQVLLTGEVPSEQDRLMAGKIASGVENVRSVENDLEVMGNSTFTQRSSDSIVTGRVKGVLVDAQLGLAFKIVTERGTVYMMGRVTEREKNLATDLVQKTSGVQRVVRVLEIISEEELARIGPPPPAPSSQSEPPKNPTN